MVKSHQAVSDSDNLSTTIVKSNEGTNRNNNLPMLYTLDLNEYEPKVYFPLKKPSSFLETPPAAPILQETGPLSIADPDNLKSPWILSFTSEHRSEGLRNLSQGNAIPMKLDTEKETAVTPIINTRSYGRTHQMHATNIAASTEGEANLGATGSHLQTCCGSMDFGGVDGAGDGSAVPYLYEMDISQRLSSRGLQSSVSSPQMSTWGSHQPGWPSSSSKVSRNQPYSMRHAEESVAPIDGSLRIWDEIKLDASTFCSRFAATPNYLPEDKSRVDFLSFLPRTRTRSQANATAIANSMSICLS